MMKWTPEAEDAVKKVPFFIRRKVRQRVEKEASSESKDTVTIAEVNATQKRFLSNMSSEVKGYQLDTCFGRNGCPNSASQSESLYQKIEAVLKKEDLLGFLKQNVKGDLKFHHEFRITLSDCPNACSQPQIKDIGIVGACEPEITNELCTLCETCVDYCKDDAVSLNHKNNRPMIDFKKCMKCGMCIKECPTGTITEGRKGYKILLGGKLGRHPRLAAEVSGIFSEDEVVNIVKKCIDFYKANSTNGKRFAELYTGPAFLNLE